MVGMFSKIKDEFFRYMGDIVCATITTVDVKGRPRSRILIRRTAVAEGTTGYTNGDFFWDLWTLRFDEEDRCAKFVE